MFWISETKTYFNLSVPGFDAYKNVSAAGMVRGGVVMLMKSYLRKFVKEVNMGTEGQIWLVLSFLTSVTLGGVYIPPIDSPYYERAHWGSIAAHAAEASGHLIVLGDLNGRVGTPALPDAAGEMYRYQGTKDEVTNSHGRDVINLCKNNDMTIMNHL